MANTFFKIKKTVITEGFDSYPSYTNDYDLTLTRFCGKENILQITARCSSTINGQSGIGYVVLTPDEIDRLIFGLLEAKLKITATGNEESAICPNED